MNEIFITNKQKAEKDVLDELIKKFDAKFFKTLSEPVRIQILRFLIENGRSDIGTIAQHLPQDKSVISRHLNLINETGILKSEKEHDMFFMRSTARNWFEDVWKYTAILL